MATALHVTGHERAAAVGRRQRQLAGVRFQAEAVDHPGRALQDRRRAGRATDQRDAGAARHAAAIRQRRVPVLGQLGRTPVANFSKPKLQLDARMQKTLPKLPDCVVHDIRRTVRSQLSALPVEQHVRELVIGHAKPGLHKVYDLYQYVDEKRTALELWQAKLRDIVQPAPDNVTKLRARKKA